MNHGSFILLLFSIICLLGLSISTNEENTRFQRCLSSKKYEFEDLRTKEAFCKEVLMITGEAERVGTRLEMSKEDEPYQVSSDSSSSAGTIVPVRGKYYWELLFSYDNRENDGKILEEYTLKESTSISKREFIRNKFSVESGFSYNQKTSFSLKYLGSSDVELNYHLKLARELEKQSETTTNTYSEFTHKRSIEIGPRSKLTLYRLCFIADGISKKTNVVSTNPGFQQKFVELKYEVSKHILGLPEVQSLLMQIFPGKDNKVEWAAIRNSIVQHSIGSEEQRFRMLVDMLRNIYPKKHNKAEWGAIRSTCNEIKTEWYRVEKQLLFNKLLSRFSITRPGKHNKREWSSIRDLSQNVLNSIKLFAVY